MAVIAHDMRLTDMRLTDLRFMSAAIRYAERHAGRTGTNPSVGCLIVKDRVIIGRGVTALGGRPHAETQALVEAGTGARGATAYVTLEPCAHHGRTPPCANALVDAGIARVVGAAADPDPRVSGRGYAILRAAGIDVEEGVLAEEAADRLAGYLTRSLRKRPEVILKLALSADGKIGRSGQRVAVTGPVANAQVHLLRARADVICVGIGTALADDPALTCRLPGLEARSPARLVIDRAFDLPTQARMLHDGGPQVMLAGFDPSSAQARALERAGARLIATDRHGDHVALPELMEDLAAMGHASVLVEGGARLARSFLEENLVDRIMLFTSPDTIGADGIDAPFTAENMLAGFRLTGAWVYGRDECKEWVRA
ncbi:MAG: bifunctional diaminohydroxyphosphoribosylaminopyrimidine deaminase/5-amino-6-(5-phosphoribosylamino)uracil reductase RibD [Rhizobiaceae bacterium]|jgi:diaminohydroxyphosphoribosylaminopyrimidine deaminase/5-amino-6-(5-phosphoribosylamino)uracil reductase|nr:bifunctional diaminohydroxyphosphoribosylaminopyrimidine deaminase/5-amino-6-(5-phosphoribosylamino)uracil reductase RibD [Rhizobiaceae bacterium]